MIYGNNFFKFSNNTKDNYKDKIPDWMDDNFFVQLQNPSKADEIIKLAKLFNSQAKDEHHCQCCNNTLNDDEVVFCKDCIKKSV